MPGNKCFWQRDVLLTDFSESWSELSLIRLEELQLGLWPRVKPFQMSLKFSHHMLW